MGGAFKKESRRAVTQESFTRCSEKNDSELFFLRLRELALRRHCPYPKTVVDRCTTRGVELTNSHSEPTEDVCRILGVLTARCLEHVFQGLCVCTSETSALAR